MVEGTLAILKDHEIEKAVLGAIMLEHAAYDRISDLLHLNLFTHPDLQNVAKIVIRLKNEGKDADKLSVVAGLKKSDYLNPQFGPYEVASITDRVAGSGLLEQHVRYLTELYMKREVIRVSHETIRKAGAYNADAFDVVDEAEKGISEITNRVVSTKIQTSEELYRESLKTNQSILDLKGKLVGISSGFRRIDEVTGGWQKSKLIVLAGATSMGKTAIALDFLVNAALSGKSVGMFSLEMPSTEVYSRIQSKVSNIDLEKITKYGLTGNELESFKLACSPLQNAKMYFDDTSGISIFQLKNRARKMKRTNGLDLLIIDYLQLMEGDKKGNREQEVASISRGLKSLAKELEIPIIALSQLSRDIDKRSLDQKEPKLSDLRESGSLEQDADIVAFVYRPEYYGITEAEDGTSLVGKGKFLIKKHRGGAWADIKLDWIGRLTKYQSEGLSSQPMPALEPNVNF